MCSDKLHGYQPYQLHHTAPVTEFVDTDQSRAVQVQNLTAQQSFTPAKEGEMLHCV